MQLPCDTDSQLGDWRDPLGLMSTEGASTSAASFGGSAGGVAGASLAPQFNAKSDKLPGDLSVGPDFSDSSESEDERVLGNPKLLKYY